MAYPRLAVFAFVTLVMGAETRSLAGDPHQSSITVGTTLPITCKVDDLFYKTAATVGWYTCTAPDTWAAQSSGSGGPPAGSILLIVSGTCPATYTESAALNGKFLRGTIAANADVGTTGGSDTITPAGTNATSTVTPLGTVGTPILSWPAGVPTNGAIGIGTFVNVAGATTGNCAATNIAAGTGSTTACKATAPNLATAAQGHSGTLTSPTISWPAGVPTSTTPSFTGSSSTVGAQTFTGTQFDNRPAYTKVIFCSKD